MKTCIVVLCALFVLCSCAAGPVYMAKNESEALKQDYSDKRSQDLYQKNADLFRDLYNRYTSAKIATYTKGIGMVTLKDENNEVLHYVMAFVRPEGLKYDINTTKAEQRFSHSIQQMPKYMKFVKSSDLDRDDIEGLAFGLYWGVKDYSQCDTYGGFLEYIQVYLRKLDAQDVIEGRRTFEDALKDAEVFTSLDLKPAKSVKPVF